MWIGVGVVVGALGGFLLCAMFALGAHADLWSEIEELRAQCRSLRGQLQLLIGEDLERSIDEELP